VPPRFQPRKLLVAAVGIATVNLACSKQPPTAGNLTAPEPTSSPSAPPTAGNLVPVPPQPTAAPPEVPTALAADAGPPPAPRPPTAGNLMARPENHPNVPKKDAGK
jgi:hypothetical protein